MSFEKFDFDSNEKWRIYFNSVEIANPTPENIDKLRKRWYKKEIVCAHSVLLRLTHKDPTYGEPASANSESTANTNSSSSFNTNRPNSNTSNDIPNNTNQSSQQPFVADENLMVHIYTLAVLNLSALYFPTLLLQISASDWMYTLILALFGLRSFYFISSSLQVRSVSFSEIGRLFERVAASFTLSGPSSA